MSSQPVALRKGWQWKVNRLGLATEVLPSLLSKEKLREGACRRVKRRSMENGLLWWIRRYVVLREQCLTVCGQMTERRSLRDHGTLILRYWINPLFEPCYLGFDTFHCLWRSRWRRSPWSAGIRHVISCMLTLYSYFDAKPAGWLPSVASNLADSTYLAICQCHVRFQPLKLRGRWFSLQQQQLSAWGSSWRKSKLSSPMGWSGAESADATSECLRFAGIVMSSCSVRPPTRQMSWKC